MNDLGLVILLLVFSASVGTAGFLIDTIQMRWANRRLQRLAKRFHNSGAGGAARIVGGMQSR